jgi:hypothetical protein
MRTSHTEACFCLPPLCNQQIISSARSSEVRETYVFRGSTRGTRSLSIQLMPGSQRTMLRFHYVVLPKENFDSLTDQGGTANVERPSVTGNLQDCRSQQRESGSGGETINVSSGSFRLMLGQERQHPQVSLGDTCFTRDTYPNSVRCHPSTPFRLGNRHLDKFRRETMEYGAPPITTLISSAIPWTIPSVWARAESPSSFVNRSNLSSVACILSFPHNSFTNFSVTC